MVEIKVLKDTIKKRKERTQKWKQVFAVYLENSGFVSLICMNNHVNKYEKPLWN
jgi:hypothetical protein